MLHACQPSVIRTETTSFWRLKSLSFEGHLEDKMEYIFCVRTGRLLNMCMQEGRMQKEWRMDLIVPIWKSTGDVHDPGKYRGITLLSQVLKLLERVLDARIRRRVEGDFGENSNGPGRGEEQQMGCTS